VPLPARPSRTKRSVPSPLMHTGDSRSLFQ
jgi:hypothetical protein